MKEQEIIEEARSWIGTRWMHGAALKGYGTDCVQFMVEVAKKFGWIPKSYESIKYYRQHVIHSKRSLILEEMAEYFQEIPVPCQMQVGDVIVFNVCKTQGHVGIYIGDQMFVHADLARGKVVEDRLLPSFNMHSVWRARAYAEKTD